MLSAILKDLAASISEISEHIDANVLVTASREAATSTFANMQDILSAMNEISMSAENIGKVVKVIDDIVFQTNILALNAAVETARADMVGKGFVVVADKVRNLAQKSSQFVNEITPLIEAVISAVVQTNSATSEESAATAEEVATQARLLKSLVDGFELDQRYHP